MNNSFFVLAGALEVLEKLCFGIFCGQAEG